MNKKHTKSLYSGASPETIAADLKPLLEFQDKGIPIDELNVLIEKKLIPHLVEYDRPEFHSLYNSFPEEGAEVGARIALHYNQGVTNWLVSPGGVMLEELCIKVLCRLFNLPHQSDGTFMYCGTYANQQALYMALHRKAEQAGFNLSKVGLAGFSQSNKLAVIASEDVHFSLKHAVRILGLGDQALITLPVDNKRKLDIDKLYTYIEKNKSEKDFFCIVASAGTTSTGSVDPIQPITEIGRQNNMWVHVDGAYGLSFNFLPEKHNLFEGIDKADSLCWDPHKQMGVPIPNSLLFVRQKQDFNRMTVYGNYFNRPDDLEPNPGLKSPPSTRPFSALPLVASIRHQGLTRLRERLRVPLNAIEGLVNELKNYKDVEVCLEPELGILCYRLLPHSFPIDKLNDLQRFIFESIKQQGKRSLSLTSLGDRLVLRLVALSPTVTTRSMLDTIEYTRTLARSYQK
ncbi:MAG: aspartate aminotransferase family protein [Candidatus Aminicenantes bacterium]|nr:aspartate aminotransferase family protein [Candidatus Aminicenantes bacterium]